MRIITRRDWLGGAIAAGLSAQPSREPIVDTHVHLFAADQKAFPYHPNAPYKPAAQPVEDYARFAVAAGITHAVIVHPEPYQDDHRYLEYCFAHEPSPQFFKGTCLFDPVAPDTPARIEALVKRNPGRIVAMRIHEMAKPGTAPSTGGAIKDRDLQSPAMKNTWRAMERLGLAVQIQTLPDYAPQVRELMQQFPRVAVILDHLGRPGQGAPAAFDGVLKLARFPRVYIKYSEAKSASKEPYPYSDVKPIVRRAFEAFGPDRMLWGGLGMDRKAFDQQARLFALMFDFASDADRAKIQGGNARRLFAW